MKQKLLFSILFLAISLKGNAQLTVTGTIANTGNIGYNTSTGQFYTFYPTGTFPPGAITNIFPLVKDPSSNLYAINNDLSGVYYQYKFIVRIGNYWYLGYKVFIYPTNSFSLQLRYPVQTNSVDPPCNGLWEERSDGVPLDTYVGKGTYQMVTIAGTTCSTNNPINPSPFNIFSNSISIPSLTYGQIINIPPPITTGTMVYNTTNNCVSIYNGTSWSCLVAASSATYNATTLTTLPFTLTNLHNYIVYTGTAGTLTIPVASTCVGRLYNISNYGTGIITLSQPYTIANATTSTTINQNINVQIIATATGWYKVN